MIKDIELVSNDKGGFDWNFENGDLNTVIADKRLISACKHAVMLKPDELTLSLYEDKGCTAHNYVTGLNTDHTKTLVRESIIMACKEVEGVTDARVEIDETQHGYEMITELIATNSSGEEVIII